MIKIGICDDENIHIAELSTILKNISQTNNLDIELNCFTSGTDLINFYSNHGDHYDILFLDILINECNGIDVAKAIRELSCTAHIIFGTISKEYALDSYSVNAYKYILKPYEYTSIENLILDLSYKINLSRKNTICVKNNQDVYSFKLEEVVYFESNLRKIIVHLSNGEKITFYDKMSDFEKKLQCNMFIRCHRSFLVNLIYVKNIVASNIITTNNDYIPISKKYLSSSRDVFKEFIKSKL